MYPFGKRYKCDLLNFLYIYNVLLQSQAHFGYVTGELGPVSRLMNSAVTDLISVGTLTVVPIEDSLHPLFDKIGLKHDFDLSLNGLYRAAHHTAVDDVGIKMMRSCAAKMFFLTSYETLDIILAAMALSRHLDIYKGFPVNVPPSSFEGYGFPFDENTKMRASVILTRLGLMSSVLSGANTSESLALKK